MQTHSNHRKRSGDVDRNGLCGAYLVQSSEWFCAFITLPSWTGFPSHYSKGASMQTLMHNRSNFVNYSV